MHPALLRAQSDLERHLEKIGKLQALEDVRAVSRLARISYTYQKEMRGLGDAVLLGREFVGTILSSPCCLVTR